MRKRAKIPGAMTKAELACVLVAACGGMWALASSVVVYNAWRVAIFASAYKAEEIEIQEVSYSKSRRWGASLTGDGLVGGRKEKIGLSDFGEFYHSQAELEAAYPRGRVIPIWYDPSAADIRTQKSYLRVLPATYPLDRAVKLAVITTVKHQGLLVIGICLVFGQPRMSRTNEQKGHVQKGARRKRLRAWK